MTFLSEEVDVPTLPETQRCRLRPITMGDDAEDYYAMFPGLGEGPPLVTRAGLRDPAVPTSETGTKIEEESMNGPELHLDVRIGHVHLRVADLERAVGFYRDALGFDATAHGPDFGLPGAAFLSAGGYHHIGLNTWTSEGGIPPPGGHTGLYHFAVLYPDRAELGSAVGRLLENGHSPDGAEDHGATVSVYLHDPDGNGIELYYDRPREAWFDSRGVPTLKAEPFDPRELSTDATRGNSHPTVKQGRST